MIYTTSSFGSLVTVFSPFLITVLVTIVLTITTLTTLPWSSVNSSTGTLWSNGTFSSNDTVSTGISSSGVINSVNDGTISCGFFGSIGWPFTIMDSGLTGFPPIRYITISLGSVVTVFSPSLVVVLVTTVRTIITLTSLPWSSVNSSNGVPSSMGKLSNGIPTMDKREKHYISATHKSVLV